MFMSLVLSFLALLLLRTNGHNIPERYTPPQAHCIDYVVPVTVTSDDYQWVGPRWTDNFGLTEFVTTVVTRPAASFPPPFGNPVASTALYEISATFCTPKKGSPKAKTVLLATHGLAFSRRLFFYQTVEPVKGLLTIAIGIPHINQKNTISCRLPLTLATLSFSMTDLARGALPSQCLSLNQSAEVMRPQTS